MRILIFLSLALIGSGQKGNMFYDAGYCSGFEWGIPVALTACSQVTDRRPVNNPVPGRNY